MLLSTINNNPTLVVSQILKESEPIRKTHFARPMQVVFEAINKATMDSLQLGALSIEHDGTGK